MPLAVVSMGKDDLLSCVGRLNPLLEQFAQQRYGEAIVTAAWQNFSRWGAVAIAHEKESYQLAFTAWWLYAWLPDDQDLLGLKFDTPAPDQSVAADYLQLHHSNLDLVERRVIEGALKSPYSFYTVLSIESNNRMRIQEIYSEKKIVIAGDAAVSCAPGDVLFTAVLTVSGVSMLLGCMPQVLYAESLLKIETHRDKWRKEVGSAIDQRLLYLHDTELRRYYFLLLNQQQQAALH